MARPHARQDAARSRSCAKRDGINLLLASDRVGLEGVVSKRCAVRITWIQEWTKVKAPNRRPANRQRWLWFEPRHEIVPQPMLHADLRRCHVRGGWLDALTLSGRWSTGRASPADQQLRQIALLRCLALGRWIEAASPH